MPDITRKGGTLSDPSPETELRKLEEEDLIGRIEDRKRRRFWNVARPIISLGILALIVAFFVLFVYPRFFG